MALATAVAFLALLMWLWRSGQIPIWVVAAYGLFSAAAFVLYGIDKSAAVRRGRRTPESTLHTIGLLGGWPGALVARRVFQHKTTKQPFTGHFWCTVALNSAALGVLRQFN